MNTMVKSVPKEESWAWRNGDYISSDAVKCINHQFKNSDRSFVSGTIEPGEDHGWTTAKSDYYYLITGGSGEFYFGEQGSFIAQRATEVKADDCFVIKAGTVYNYRAGENGLNFVLFMNNLWEE